MLFKRTGSLEYDILHAIKNSSSRWQFLWTQVNDQIENVYVAVVFKNLDKMCFTLLTPPQTTKCTKQKSIYMHQLYCCQLGFSDQSVLFYSVEHLEDFWMYWCSCKNVRFMYNFSLTLIVLGSLLTFIVQLVTVIDTMILTFLNQKYSWHQ